MVVISIRNRLFPHLYSDTEIDDDDDEIRRNPLANDHYFSNEMSSEYRYNIQPKNYHVISSPLSSSPKRIRLMSSSSSSAGVTHSPLGRWIKHYYNSSHRILVVGDGDFSFSASLAAAFGCASNMVATSLDSRDFLVKNYKNASLNLFKLELFWNCQVMHGIDATQMANHPSFRGRIKFDRIIYNFPFAGFFKNLSRTSQLGLHQRLVSQFLENAKKMVSENGEIHITHKTNGFHMEWKLESIACDLHGLRLVEAVDFNLDDYPGYNTKRGFGGDDNFNCYPSKTYKFGLIGSYY